jgi:type VI secretion system secreted protein VgrG
MAFTKLRKDNVSFHGKSVIEITELTFAQYRQKDWTPLIVGEFPRLTCANQYDETDYNHMHRRWEEFGLHYWYEHRVDGHTLFLSDRSALAQPIDPTGIDDSGEIPFRDKAGSLEDDGIREWIPMRSIGSGQTTLVSFDYKNPVAQRASAESLNNQGDVFPYEVYENTGSDGFRTYREGEKLAQQRMGERDANTQTFEAHGNDRTAQPGRFFKLGDHFSAEPQAAKNGEAPHANIADRDYLILSVDHEASNNYQAGPGAPSNYDNTFRCIRKNIQWRPGRHYNSQPCTYPGIQTAIVVGPAGSEIHTDGYGRVKVQFHWDRLGKYDENSSAWLRVMSPGAGSEFGNIRLPRVGEEVAVLYLDANIDHPVILGALYNAMHMPPWQLPEQQALSGLRSRELQAGGGSGRGNHLVLDDTAGKIQAQLKSDHQCSQLSLGHITRVEDTSGRKDARGEGFELRTDGHGVVRAAAGLLVTTESRQCAQSPMKAMEETTQRLKTAHKLHNALAHAAIECEAQESGQQNTVADGLEAQHNAIRGNAHKFPELTEPHLVLASPVGIETTTAKSTHIASGEHTSLTSGHSLSIATGNSFFASVKQTFRLFVQAAGMKLIAAAGKVTVQAQDGDVDVIAHKVLTLISQSDWIDLKGKKGIRLHGAGSMVEISDRVQIYTATPVLIHGNLETLGPQRRVHPDYKRIAKNFTPIPERGKYDERFRFVAEDGETPLAHRHYRILAQSGQCWEGITNADGLTDRIYASSPEELSVEII